MKRRRPERPEPERPSPEVRDRAIRALRDYGSMPTPVAINLLVKMNRSPAALRAWVERAEQRAADLAALTEAERQRLKELERENSELRQTNDLLRRAALLFAEAAFGRRIRGE